MIRMPCLQIRLGGDVSRRSILILCLFTCVLACLRMLGFALFFSKCRERHHRLSCRIFDCCSLSCLCSSMSMFLDCRSATAPNPPLPAWTAQTGAASGRQGRSREAGARQRQSLRTDADPVHCRQQQATTGLNWPHRTRASGAKRRDLRSSGQCRTHASRYR
jgi:hypothetical protein